VNRISKYQTAILAMLCIDPDSAPDAEDDGSGCGMDEREACEELVEKGLVEELEDGAGFQVSDDGRKYLHESKVLTWSAAYGDTKPIREERPKRASRGADEDASLIARAEAAAAERKRLGITKKQQKEMRKQKHAEERGRSGKEAAE